MKKPIALFFIATLLCCVQSDPEVRIPSGVLNGTTLTTRLNRTILAFIGVPYAEPPIGNLRFQSPVPKKSWSGVLNVQEAGNVCVQFNMNNEVVGSEDCLFLNVYTPWLRSPQKPLLPVMVYLHGGGFLRLQGGPAEVGPEYLLDRDVILVTLNYRLAVFGFLSTGDKTSPGNYALKDQLLVLKWVRKNIRAFGGNPFKVTFVGNSAGADLVSLHALSERSKGYFQKYVMQSGCPNGQWSIATDAEYFRYGKKIASMLDCPTENNTVIIDCLREQPTEKLYIASRKVSDESRLTWAPVVEPRSRDAILTEMPEVLLKANRMKKAPIISGNVQDEGLIATTEYFVNDEKYNALKTQPVEEIRKILEFYQPLQRRNATELAEKVNLFYFNDISFDDRHQAVQRLADFAGDYLFRYPQLLMNLQLKHRVKSLYVYNFGYQGAASLSQQVTDNKNVYGVDHGDELFYLFKIATFFGSSQNVEIQGNDGEMINFVIDFWASFATTGVPTSNLLADPYIWEPYSDNDNYLEIGIRNEPFIRLKHRYFIERMDFWFNNTPTFPL